MNRVTYNTTCPKSDDEGKEKKNKKAKVRSGVPTCIQWRK